jgi:hypothetical protein
MISDPRIIIGKAELFERMVRFENVLIPYQEKINVGNEDI